MDFEDKSSEDKQSQAGAWPEGDGEKVSHKPTDIAKRHERNMARSSTENINQSMTDNMTKEQDKDLQELTKWWYDQLNVKESFREYDFLKNILWDPSYYDIGLLKRVNPDLMVHSASMMRWMLEKAISEKEKEKIRIHLMTMERWEASQISQQQKTEMTKYNAMMNRWYYEHGMEGVLKKDNLLNEVKKNEKVKQVSVETKKEDRIKEERYRQQKIPAFYGINAGQLHGIETHLLVHLLGKWYNQVKTSEENATEKLLKSVTQDKQISRNESKLMSERITEVFTLKKVIEWLWRHEEDPYIKNTLYANYQSIRIYESKLRQQVQSTKDQFSVPISMKDQSKKDQEKKDAASQLVARYGTRPHDKKSEQIANTLLNQAKQGKIKGMLTNRLQKFAAKIPFIKNFIRQKEK